MVVYSDWSYFLDYNASGRVRAEVIVKSIGAAKFKEQCLALLERLDPEGLVITKHGRPVAVVLPYRQASARLIGSLADDVEIHGDLLSTGLDWNADAEP